MFLIRIMTLLCGVMAFCALGLDDQGNRKLALALETIDANDLHAYIDFMASDALYGRNAGTAGNRRTVDWIASRFQRLGLIPGGDDGTFFQSFSFRPRGTSNHEETVRNVIGNGDDDRIGGRGISMCGEVLPRW